MKVFAPLAAAILLAAGAAATEPLIVNNLYVPIATICNPITFTWSGGIPPYSLFLTQIISETEGADIEQFPAQTNTSFTWTVDIYPIPSDSLVLKVIDAAGNSSESFPFTIEDSIDHVCLPPPPAKSSSTPAPVQSTNEFIKIGGPKILGIGLGALAALLLLATWRIYVLRSRRRSAGIDGDKENLVIHQKFQLSEFRKL